MPTVEEVVSQYVSLRDRKAEIAKRQEEELAPLSDAMGHIESWLMSEMNKVGCDSFKTSAGTAFKKNSNSVRMLDAEVFKEHVFQPAAEAIYHYLVASGFSIPPADIEAIKSLLQSKTKWDMVDFRVGKKGVLEHLEETSALPPGVSVETISVVNVRRA